MRIGNYPTWRWYACAVNARTLEKEAPPGKELARLAELLLESLDDLSEQGAQRLWLDEAQRRAKEIDEGEVSLVSSEELDCHARAALKVAECADIPARK